MKGRRLTGDVDVTMSALDITDQRQLASAPGDFTARMRNGTIRNLETFGLFELVAESDGRAVRFAPGKAATVELEVPKEMPAIVPSFRFDERTGRWNQQTTEWQSAGPRIVTAINWLDWWNADMPFDTTCLAVDVLGCRSCEGAPNRIAGATVTASPSGYFGATYSDTTNGNAPVCLPAKKGAHAKIDVVYAGHASNPLIVATDPSMLNPNNCASCPLVTVTHTVDGPLSEQLTMEPSSGWCASDYWNQNEFGSAWLKDGTHLAFSNLGMTLTLNDKDAQGSGCDPVTIDPITNKRTAVAQNTQVQNTRRSAITGTARIQRRSRPRSRILVWSQASLSYRYPATTAPWVRTASMDGMKSISNSSAVRLKQGIFRRPHRERDHASPAISSYKRITSRKATAITSRSSACPMPHIRTDLFGQQAR